ncbi:hypothetical protein KL86DPRO_11826 [uncultured delta proteobacterium]|uniref:Uncharacterized protein n=1 Tax=uncultured delta proteobacterium TaxID=34034 RepID=A0A212JMR0_9DELT|nr:hypothetical protein KL86DPRO_11826 [uncultured delta proteobacterium]
MCVVPQNHVFRCLAAARPGGQNAHADRHGLFRRRGLLQKLQSLHLAEVRLSQVALEILFTVFLYKKVAILKETSYAKIMRAAMHACMPCLFLPQGMYFLACRRAFTVAAT